MTNILVKEIDHGCQLWGFTMRQKFEMLVSCQDSAEKMDVSLYAKYKYTTS